MNFDLHKILAGALTGLLAAVAVDLDAFRKSGGATVGFDVALALKRWLSGALLGALGAAGLAQVNS